MPVLAGCGDVLSKTRLFIVLQLENCSLLLGFAISILRKMPTNGWASLLSSAIAIVCVQSRNLNFGE